MERQGDDKTTFRFLFIARVSAGTSGDPAATAVEGAWQHKHGQQAAVSHRDRIAWPRNNNTPCRHRCHHAHRFDRGYFCSCSRILLRSPLTVMTGQTLTKPTATNECLQLVLVSPLDALQTCLSHLPPEQVLLVTPDPRQPVHTTRIITPKHSQEEEAKT